VSSKCNIVDKVRLKSDKTGSVLEYELKEFVFSSEAKEVIGGIYVPTKMLKGEVVLKEVFGINLKVDYTA
jgi:hypothetical protein